LPSRLAEVHRATNFGRRSDHKARTAVVLAAVVFLTFCSAASNAATPKGVAVHCTISRITLGKAALVTATGKCVEPKSATNPRAKNLPVKWTHQLVSVSDQLGYACTLPANQRAAKAGKSFRLVPAGAYSAKVNFKITSVKAKGRPSKSYSKTVQVRPLGNGLHCAKLGVNVQPLPVDQLCPWRDPLTESQNDAVCDLPDASAVGFVTPVTMQNNVVSAGYVANSAGNCVSVPYTQPVNWFGSQATTAGAVSCPDGSHWGLGAYNVNLTTPSGETCSVQAPYILITAFAVPSAWAGDTLRVTFVIRNQNSNRYESGVFQLPGTASGDPCPLHF
jgi:hypothetical protein